MTNEPTNTSPEPRVTTPAEHYLSAERLLKRAGDEPALRRPATLLAAIAHALLARLPLVVADDAAALAEPFDWSNDA